MRTSRSERKQQCDRRHHLARCHHGCRVGTRSRILLLVPLQGVVMDDDAPLEYVHHGL